MKALAREVATGFAFIVIGVAHSRSAASMAATSSPRRML